MYLVYCRMSAKSNPTTDCEFCEEIHQQGLKSQQPKLSAAGKTVLAIGGIVAVVIYGVAIPFVLPGFRRICLPYVPATEQQINNILACLRGRSGTLVDLGSGDGRIIMAVMKANLSSTHQLNLKKADGVELNSWLVLYSRFSKWRQRNVLQRDRISFYKRNIFKTDLGLYDNIVVFGVESLMVELEDKLLVELADDGLVIACRFPLPNWEPAFVEGDGIDKAWVYNRNSCVTGTPV